MDFRILGPLEVLDDGRALDLGGAKQRAALAMLAVHANRVVAQERLIEALWDEEPPETARKALQVYVSQLRKVLGRERLETKPRGYLLRLEPDELDLTRFELLRDSGKPGQALQLWRGDPLADFADQRFAEPEIARLEELRLACLEQRVELDLADGRHAELIGELEALVRLHPLREHLRAQLMLALYRSGRQAEALEAYQAARAALVDGLGLEPGPELRELHQQILTQDPALDPAAPEPAKRAAPSSPAEPPAPMAESRKTVTVLFCDLADSTELGERLDPESLRGLMSRWYGAMREPLERHGGTVEKFIGDAVMAVFGVPHVHEDDALRAVRAAVEMRERLAGLNEELAAEGRPQLRIRIGVNSGEVVTGDHATTLVTGDAVNTAKRLEEAAGADEILIGDATRRLVDNAALLEPAEPVAAKGKRKPVRAWRVLETIEGAAPFARRTDTPIVGRVSELNVLRSELAAAERERSCRLVTVLGTAGLGKSRLASELMEEVEPRVTVLTARCLPYGDGITFWPLLELIQSAGGDHALADAVGDEPDRDLIVSRLSVLTGSAASSSPEETFWAVRRVLETLARERPLVVHLEDIHWAEPTLLDLVEYIAGWSRDAPILLLCLARPELLDKRPGWLNARGTSLILEPLSEDESDEMLETLDVALGAGARSRIRDAAEGNPLFVEQMVAMLVEDPGQTEMPPSIQALLAARLDRLAPLDRSILERASVLGKEFARGSVAELSPPEERNTVGTVLLALTRRDLIEPGRTPVPGDDGYRFRHALIRDAAYAGLPKKIRADLHERAGALMERRGVAGELVGYHLEQAYRYRDQLGVMDDATLALGAHAGELLGAAGKRALSRGDAAAAVNLLTRAAALFAREDPMRTALLPALGAALRETGELVRAEDVIGEALARAAESSDRLAELSALIEKAALHLSSDPGAADTDALVHEVEHAIPVLETFGEDRALAQAWSIVGSAAGLWNGRFAHGEDALERALEHSRRAVDRRQEAFIVSRLGFSWQWGPTPVPAAIARCQAIREEAGGDRLIEAGISRYLACLEARLGRFDLGRSLAVEARKGFEELGMRLTAEAVRSFSCADIELLASNYAEAERELRVAETALTAMGERAYLSTVRAFLARALYAQGRFGEAAELAAAARETTASYDFWTHAMSGGIQAKVLAQNGKCAEAKEAAHEALDPVSRTDALELHGIALLGVAEVLRLCNDAHHARPYIEDALRCFEQKGATVLADGARALL